MALINDQVDSSIDGGLHINDAIPNSNGEYVFSVSRGRRVLLNVDNPNAAVFDVIYYTISADEATKLNITRTKGIFESGITDVKYSKASLTGFAEVGIELTSAAAGVKLEVSEWKS